MIRPTILAIVLVAATTVLGLPAEKDMRLKRQLIYGNQCLGNQCCGSDQCNNCVNSCTNNCQIQQPQASSCPQACAQNCIQQPMLPQMPQPVPIPQPIYIPQPIQPPVVIQPPNPPQCNPASPTESCQMTETVVTNKNTTLNGNLENAVNVSTIINLSNVINNTNIINNPVHVNSTNINNINIAGYKYNQETDNTANPAPVIVNNQQDKPQQCCNVLAPQQCMPIQEPPYRRCFRRRYRECSPVCQQGFNQPPQPIPQMQVLYQPQPMQAVQQPVQQPCQQYTSTLQYPYVQCAQQYQSYNPNVQQQYASVAGYAPAVQTQYLPAVNYGQNCAQCYTGCPPNMGSAYCDNQRKFCVSNCGFTSLGLQPTVSVEPTVTNTGVVGTEEGEEDDNDDCEGDDC